jgi:hypothetical protein
MKPVFLYAHTAYKENLYFTQISVYDADNKVNKFNMEF